MSVAPLRPTRWLARRLGLSVTTVERLRAQGGDALPPHLTVGRHSIRYDEAAVEAWIGKRLAVAQPPVADPAAEPAVRCRLTRMGIKTVALPA